MPNIITRVLIRINRRIRYREVNVIMEAEGQSQGEIFEDVILLALEMEKEP